MRKAIVFFVLTGLFFAACAAAATPPTDEGAPRPAEGDDFGRERTGTGAPNETDRLIVRTGSLELEVADVPAAYQQARQLALRLGGYVGDSQFATDREGRTSAIVVLRIPADRYEEALDALRPLASKVVLERSQESDVTSQVVDLDARITNLRASEAALVKLFDRAGKISEVLEVQRELTSVREQIEQLVAEKQLLEKQAALATLTVTFAAGPAPITTAARSWDPGAEVEGAVAQLIDVAQAFARAGIWFAIVALPVGLVGLVILGIGLGLTRRLGLWPRRAVGPGNVPPTSPAA